MNKIRKLKLNIALRGYPAGKTITITCDLAGIPKDSYWKRRLEDAVKDNCCELLPEKKVNKPEIIEKPVKKADKKGGN